MQILGYLTVTVLGLAAGWWLLLIAWAAMGPAL